MFRNRHLNFGYLLVILVVFAISISASCKPAYAASISGPNGALGIRFDLKDGTIVDVTAVGLPKPPAVIAVSIPEQPEIFPPPGKMKKITHCFIINWEGSNCITFYILGKMYEYCP